MLVLDENLIKLHKSYVVGIPGACGTYLRNRKILRRGTPEITLRFAKILFQLWDKSTYLDLEICRTNFPKTLQFYFIWLVVSNNKIWKKSNSVFLRKSQLCSKNTVSNIFSRKFHFSQKNWIKFSWNFFSRYLWSMWVFYGKFSKIGSTNFLQQLTTFIAFSKKQFRDDVRNFTAQGWQNFTKIFLNSPSIQKPCHKFWCDFIYFWVRTSSFIKNGALRNL